MIRPIAIEQMQHLASERCGAALTRYPKRVAVSRSVRRRIWRQLLWEESQGLCAYCGVETPPEHRTIEHLIPISKGGPTHLCNLVAACAVCNNHKPNDVLPTLYCKNLAMFFLVLLKEKMAYEFFNKPVD